MYCVHLCAGNRDALRSTVPVKYGYCDEDVSYMTSGKGLLTFNFTNLRADIGFVYFTNGTRYPIRTGQAHRSMLVSFKNVEEPLRPRVVATGNPDRLKLLWSSATPKLIDGEDEEAAYRLRKQVVRWGTKSGVYTNTIVAHTDRHVLAKETLCGAPATTYGYREQGDTHTALFDHMTQYANQNLYYIFGDETTNNFSKEYMLHVPPLVGANPPDRPTTIVLYDDLGRVSYMFTHMFTHLVQSLTMISLCRDPTICRTRGMSMAVHPSTPLRV
jgi:hypothetical protein